MSTVTQHDSLTNEEHCMTMEKIHTHTHTLLGAYYILSMFKAKLSVITSLTFC